MKSSREKKPNRYFDKIFKGKFENKKVFHYTIKNNEIDKNGYELLKKDIQFLHLLKNKGILINDIQKTLNKFVINKDITKELKKENDSFFKQVSNIKAYKKHYLKSYDENFETYQKFEDLIIKYKQKGFNKIPKLNQNLNNIFKKEPILSGNDNENMFESLIFNPKSVKNILFLQKIKDILNDLIEEKKKENKNNLIDISKNENQNLNNSNYNIKNNPSQNHLINNSNLNYNENKSISNIFLKGNDIINKKNNYFENKIFKLSKNNYENFDKGILFSSNLNNRNKNNEININNKSSSFEKNFNYFNGQRYYNKEDKKILEEIKELLNNIKNVEEEKKLNDYNHNLKKYHNLFFPIPKDKRKSFNINSEHYFKKGKTLSRIKSNQLINKIKNINIHNLKQNKSMKNFKIKNKENFHLINSNIKKKIKLKFDTFKNEEDFFSYAFEELKKLEFQNIFYMLKLFLQKFRNFSNEEIDKIFDSDNKNPISILEKIKQIKQIISNNKIVDKTKNIYLRNNSIDLINHKIKVLSENENQLFKMERYFLKMLNDK